MAGRWNDGARLFGPTNPLLGLGLAGVVMFVLTPEGSANSELVAEVDGGPNDRVGERLFDLVALRRRACGE